MHTFHQSIHPSWWKTPPKAKVNAKVIARCKYAACQGSREQVLDGVEDRLAPKTWRRPADTLQADAAAARGERAKATVCCVEKKWKCVNESKRSNWLLLLLEVVAGCHPKRCRAQCRCRCKPQTTPTAADNTKPQAQVPPSLLPLYSPMPPSTTHVFGYQAGEE